MPGRFNNRLNQGDDCAGTVAALGSAVTGFQIGERVAGFHQMDTPHGTYAEYAICPEQTVFRIPAGVSDEEAATLPLAMYTAAVGLYRNLQVPAPWERSDEHAPDTAKVPLVVNGASSAVGAFAIKFAKLSPRVGPIIATAGASADFVRALGVDAVVDYRSPTAAQEIQKAAGGLPIRHIFDASNSVASVKHLTEAIAPGPASRYTCTTSLDAPMEKTLKAVGIWFEQISVGDVHEQPLPSHASTGAGGKVFGAIISKLVERALANGSFSGHPFDIVAGGLDGVEGALFELRDRKHSSNQKFVTRIADTPGLGVKAA